jgi:hypothetical protein
MQLVNVQTLKIVELLTSEAKDRVAHDYAYMDTLAVEYIAVHDRPPVDVQGMLPTGLISSPHRQRGPFIWKLAQSCAPNGRSRDRGGVGLAKSH